MALYIPSIDKNFKDFAFIYLQISSLFLLYFFIILKVFVSSGTASNNETGGGIAYNAARNRIITYGATASTSGATYNFEYHTVNGTGYTSQGSATTIETGLRARTIHVTSVQTNSFHANSTIMVYAALGDATNGGRVKFLDPGA